MTELLLQPTADPSNYEVIAGSGQPVGRIALYGTSHMKPWLWSIDHQFHDGHDPVRGFEATREAAMQAFAKSWHRE
jgi:hypothetical protein